MSAVLVNQLTYLLGTVRANFRALLWRTVLPIRTGIPEWAENVQQYKIVNNAAEPVPHQIGNQKAPTPSFDRSKGSLPLLEFALGMNIWDAELARKEQTGIDVSEESSLANSRSCEEFLDKIAALGDTRYGLPGLVNSADVTTLTINGDWANQDQESVLLDASNIIFQVFSQSKNLLTAKVLLVPDDTYATLGSRYNTLGTATFLELIQKANPGVTIKPWYKLRTAGAGGTRRVVAFDNAQDVAAMLMVHEFRNGEALRVHGGYEVLQTVKTGGVMIKQAQGICYADGV